MIRLLAILVALNCASNGDGAPRTAVVDSTGDAEVSDNINQSDLILDESNTGKKEALGTEPTLKARTLCNDLGKKASSLLGKQPRTSNSGKSMLPGWATKHSRRAGKGKALAGPTENTTEQIDTVENDSQAKNGPTPGTYEYQVMLYKQGNAIDFIKGVRFPLKGSDPLKDKKLAELIDSALAGYHEAFNLPLPNYKGLDEKSRIKAQLAEYKKLLAKVEAQKSQAANQSTPTRATLIPQAEINEFKDFHKPKEDAEKVVLTVKLALSLPKANPFKDEELARLVGSAVQEYLKTHRKPPLRLEGLDKEEALALELEELDKIAREIEYKRETRRQLEGRIDGLIGQQQD